MEAVRLSETSVTNGRHVTSMTTRVYMNTAVNTSNLSGATFCSVSTTSVAKFHTRQGRNMADTVFSPSDVIQDLLQVIAYTCVLLHVSARAKAIVRYISTNIQKAPYCKFCHLQ
jgi:hypothetical protein